MSGASYRAAAGRLREALDLMGPFRLGCGLCGHPDARHRQADAITGGLLAGDDLETVAEEYAPPGVDAVSVWEVAFATLATDPRLHGLSRGRANDLDSEVWASPVD